MERLSIEYCEANRTKRATRGYKVRCPSCSGNDLWITLDNATGFCWECGVNYRIGSDDGVPRRTTAAAQNFDTAAIRDIYHKASDYYHSCITGEHVQFLQQRGIDSKAIDTFKIGFCPPGTSPLYSSESALEAGLADRRGNPWLANRIVFPYMADHAVTDLRGRSMDPADSMKYKSLYHRAESRGAVYPFNYDRVQEKNTSTVILTEGEIKAVVGDIFGFSIVALPGMLSYRPMFNALAGKRIIVMFDNMYEREDRVRIDRAIANLSRKIPAFSVVTLPLLGEHKMDVDSFLLHERGGASRLQYYVDNAVEYSAYLKLRKF